MDYLTVLGLVLGFLAAVVVIGGVIFCCICCCPCRKKKVTNEQPFEGVYVDSSRSTAPKKRSDDLPQVVVLSQHQERPASQRQRVKDYSVSSSFMEKHVSTLSERPTRKKSHFADKNARKAYKKNGLPLPPKYSIIYVSNKNTFCKAIAKEAKNHRAQENIPFTTREEFYVMNFALNYNNGHYNYVDDEGDHSLELSIDSNCEINHLESVVPW